MTESPFNIRQSNLSAAKRALLEQRLKPQFIPDLYSSAISRRSDQSHAPLSFPQERMARIYKDNGRSTYYIRAMRLNGALNLARLTDALMEILRRHESLRTTIADQNGTPVQVIAESPSLCLRFIDLGAIVPETLETQAQDLVRQCAEEPYNLFGDPVVRVTLLHLSNSEHWLVVVLSHIMFDQWSLNLFQRELCALFDAYGSGRPSPLQELTIQYGDYACWQRRNINAESLKWELDYWRKQLKAVRLGQLLPVDRKRPKIESFIGKIMSYDFSKKTSDAIKDLAQKEAATLVMIVVAIFKGLLYQYSWEPNVVIQIATTNRKWLEVENVIGSFVNNVVLRSDVSGNPTFRELLRRVKEVIVMALVHHEIPLEFMLNELQALPSINSDSHCQVAVTVQSQTALDDDLNLGDLEITPLLVKSDTILYDAILKVVDKPKGLTCSIIYKTDLFDDDTIALMLGNFEMHCERIAGNPDLGILELPMLGTASSNYIPF